MRKTSTMGRVILGTFTLALAGAGGRSIVALAEPPELASWLLNTTGLTGYNGLPANVQMVRYSAGYVYVNSSGIPSYSIGPWPGNPNTSSNQGYLFKIPRHPAVNTGAKISTPLGHIGVWVNGVVAFNPLDARSYNNQNIWHQNAVVVEGPAFDACLGHPAPGGRYHHHQNPLCLYTGNPPTHSPILGYAFDGYPIYGPYAYANTDGSGGIARMRSSYRLRAITQRTTLPDGTVLAPSQYGPVVSASYPLGFYVEDYEYVSGLGDLDAYNGRSTVRPEYPGGTYAYFVTVDANGASTYPYAIGPKYNGVVATENLSTMGHVTILESVTTYTPPPAAGRVDDTLLVGPAASGQIVLSWGPSCGNGVIDYGIYDGAIGSWYSHVGIDCHDDLGDLTETILPAPGNRYYLVVPQSTGDEGTYGTGSSGAERPRGTAVCVSTQSTASCP